MPYYALMHFIDWMISMLFVNADSVNSLACYNSIDRLTIYCNMLTLVFKLQH